MFEDLPRHLIQWSPRTAQEILADLAEIKCPISCFAREQLEHALHILNTSSVKKGCYTIVEIPLGKYFDHRPTTDEIFALGQQGGLQRPPLALPFYFARESHFLSAGDWLVFMSEPVMISTKKAFLSVDQDRRDDSKRISAVCSYFDEWNLHIKVALLEEKTQ